MSRSSPVTFKQVEEMKEYKEAGFSYAEIANEMGLNYYTVYKYIGNGYKPSEEILNKMQELQRLGLSHKQIAITLNISPYVVRNGLGVQKAANRSAYGSLAAHAEGESFLPKGMENILDKKPEETKSEVEKAEEKKSEVEKVVVKKSEVKKPVVIDLKPEDKFKNPEKETTMKIVKSSITFEGQKFSYKLSSDGNVRMTSANGFTIDLKDDEFSNFMKELKEVTDWRSKNTVDMPPFMPCSARVAV